MNPTSTKPFGDKPVEHRQDEPGCGVAKCAFEDMIPRLRFLWHASVKGVEPDETPEEKSLRTRCETAFLAVLRTLEPDSATAVRALLNVAESACCRFDRQVASGIVSFIAKN